MSKRRKNMLVHSLVGLVKNKRTAIWKSKGFGTIAVFLVLCIFFSSVSKSFFTIDNILNILWQISGLIIVSLGMTWIIISGGIDLSVGATMGLCGVTSAMLIKFANFPVLVGLLVSILLGGVVGFLKWSEYYKGKYSTITCYYRHVNCNPWSRLYCV
ncbi:MAG: ABC transporter permease [Flexilinea sp.]